MRARIIVCIYMLLLVLPGAAMILGAPDREVAGVFTKPKRPELRFWSIVSERYQHKLTAWFESAIAFKGVSMYVDNTILARVFGESKPDAHVAIGEDGVLFIKEDLDGYNRTPEQVPDRAFVENTVSRMAELQRRMREKRRVFLPVLIPSKTRVYHDKLPARWLRDLETRTAERLYPMMKEVLDAKGVDYIDMGPLLLGKDRRLVWGPYARHWSRYAACEALRAALERYAAHTATPPIALQCTVTYEDRFPDHDDFDLWRLLNAAMPVADRRVPVVKHAPATNQPKPNAIFMGTSFNWNIIREAAESGVFGRLYLNYYNKTFVAWPADIHTPVEPHTDAWRDIVVPNDLYVVDVFETYMPLNTEMFDQLLKELDAMPSR